MPARGRYLLGASSPEQDHRLWWCLGHEVHRHQQAGQIGLAAAHALLAEGKERVAAIERQQAQERARRPQARSPPLFSTAGARRADGGVPRPACIAGGLSALFRQAR